MASGWHWYAVEPSRPRHGACTLDIEFDLIQLVLLIVHVVTSDPRATYLGY